jgi:hypothetical protein
MTFTTTTQSAANAKGEDVAAETTRPLQDLRKCKYCNYEHWDNFDLKFHEEMHKEYCEEKEEAKRQKCRDYEIEACPFRSRTFKINLELGSRQIFVLLTHQNPAGD